MAILQPILDRLAQISAAGIVLIALGAVVNFAASALYNREKLSWKAMLAWRLPALAAAFFGAVIIFLP